MKKTIYIDGVYHEYTDIQNLQPELSKANIHIGTQCEIGDELRIGRDTRIGNGVTIGKFCTIDDGCTIGTTCRIDHNTFIGYDCVLADIVKIGQRCVVLSKCNIGFNCRVHDDCRIDQSVRIYQHCTIGRDSKILSNTVITESPLHVVAIRPYVFNAYNDLVQIGCTVQTIAQWRKDYKKKVYTPWLLDQYTINRYYDLLKVAEKWHKKSAADRGLVIEIVKN